ncbi:MAG TPA: type II secretion system protein GspM, partial [Gammaproteobacteria bacterium]|nr:type II secretion system protein GspM [Gammaproteobacteria bacterium]
MIIERLNPKQQQLLAIGLMVLLLAAVYLIVVQPIVSMHQDYDGRIGELHDRLAGYKKIAGSRGALQKEFDRIKKQVTATQAGYLKSKTQALAGAELQDRVKRVIESGGGR